MLIFVHFLIASHTLGGILLMDIIDKKFELKKFFMRVYKDALISGNNLKEDEYFRILRVRTNEEGRSI